MSHVGSVVPGLPDMRTIGTPWRLDEVDPALNGGHGLLPGPTARLYVVTDPSPTAELLAHLDEF